MKVDKMEILIKKDNWRFCDVNQLKGYDYMNLSNIEICQKVRDYVHSIEAELQKKDSDSAKVKYLLEIKKKSRTKEFFEKLNHFGENSNGFTNLLVSWVDINLDDYKEKSTSQTLPSLRKILTPKSTKIVTFDLKRKPASVQSELTNLLKRIRGKYVHSSTTTTHFKMIFEGENIIKPIMWVGDNYELYYFIDALTPCLGKSKSRKWKIASACFVEANGEKFDDANLRKSVHKKTETAKEAKKRWNSYCDTLVDIITRNASDNLK